MSIIEQELCDSTKQNWKEKECLIVKSYISKLAGAINRDVQERENEREYCTHISMRVFDALIVSRCEWVILGRPARLREMATYSLLGSEGIISHLWKLNSNPNLLLRLAHRNSRMEFRGVVNSANAVSRRCRRMLTFVEPR